MGRDSKGCPLLGQEVFLPMLKCPSWTPNGWWTGKKWQTGAEFCLGVEVGPAGLCVLRTCFYCLRGKFY